MTQRKAFLTKEQSLMLRGIAIFLVLISHYAVWIGEIFHSDLLEYGLAGSVFTVWIYFLQCPATGWSKVLEKREFDSCLNKRMVIVLSNKARTDIEI